MSAHWPLFATDEVCMRYFNRVVFSSFVLLLWAAAYANSSSDPLCKKPITGIAGCCARARIGQAAAAPASVMNSRRLIETPGEV